MDGQTDVRGVTLIPAF